MRNGLIAIVAFLSFTASISVQKAQAQAKSAPVSLEDTAYSSDRVKQRKDFYLAQKLLKEGNYPEAVAIINRLLPCHKPGDGGCNSDGPSYGNLIYMLQLCEIDGQENYENGLSLLQSLCTGPDVRTSADGLPATRGPQRVQDVLSVILCLDKLGKHDEASKYKKQLLDKLATVSHQQRFGNRRVPVQEVPIEKQQEYIQQIKQLLAKPDRQRDEDTELMEYCARYFNDLHGPGLSSTAELLERVHSRQLFTLAQRKSKGEEERN